LAHWGLLHHGKKNKLNTDFECNNKRHRKNLALDTFVYVAEHYV